MKKVNLRSNDFVGNSLLFGHHFSDSTAHLQRLATDLGGNPLECGSCMCWIKQAEQRAGCPISPIFPKVAARPASTTTSPGRMWIWDASLNEMGVPSSGRSYIPHMTASQSQIEYNLLHPVGNARVSD